MPAVASTFPVTEFLIGAMVNGTQHKIAKVSFSRQDASLYIVPYGPSGTRRYACAVFPAGTATMDVQTQACEPDVHLSIHETGRVHVRSRTTEYCRVDIPDLAGFPGKHAATIVAGSLERLASLDRPVRKAGRRRDLILDQIPGFAEGLAIVLYANGSEPTFLGPTAAVVQLLRPTLPRPLYLGIGFRRENRLAAASGAMVMSGWDRTVESVDQEDSFAVLIAE
jgi:hypothetical protein